MFDLGKRAFRFFLLCGPLCALIGGLSIYSGLTGHVEGSSGTPAVVIGALFLLPALVIALSWRMMTRPRKFVLDAAGITWDDPRGRPWSVRWDELAHVEITYTMKQLRIQGGFTTQRSQQYLDLYPGYRSFRQCHPNMENWWDMFDMHNGYRMLLGPVSPSVLDEGFRKFCPQIYAGVCERER